MVIPGDPNDVAQLEAWETLPHERLSPRADTVASRMAVFRRLMHPQEGSKLFGPIRILVMPVRSLIQPVVAGLGDVSRWCSPKVRSWRSMRRRIDWWRMRILESTW